LRRRSQGGFGLLTGVQFSVWTVERWVVEDALSLAVLAFAVDDMNALD
jgi:hypothetical protein